MTPTPLEEGLAEGVADQANAIGLALGVSADVLGEAFLMRGAALVATVHGRPALVAYLRDLAAKIELSGTPSAGHA